MHINLAGFRCTMDHMISEIASRQEVRDLKVLEVSGSGAGWDGPNRNTVETWTQFDAGSEYLRSMTGIWFKGLLYFLSVVHRVIGCGVEKKRGWQQWLFLNTPHLSLHQCFWSMIDPPNMKLPHHMAAQDSTSVPMKGRITNPQFTLL